MKITNKELINAFYKGHGCRGGKDRCDISPLMPYLLCDVGNSGWRKFVVAKKPKFQLAKIVGQIKKEYHLFNYDLFGVFNDEYTDAIIDKMDEVEAISENDYRVMRATIMRALRGDHIPFEVRETYGGLLMYYNMVKTSQDLWGAISHNNDGTEQENPHLKNILYYLQKFENEYLRQHGLSNLQITLEDDAEIAKCATILQRRLGEWLIKDTINEKNEQKTLK